MQDNTTVAAILKLQLFTVAKSQETHISFYNGHVAKWNCVGLLSQRPGFDSHRDYNFNINNAGHAAKK